MSNRSFYNELYSCHRHKAWRDAPGKIVVLSYLLSLVSDHQKILDIGCGDGFFLDWIRVESISRNKQISVFGIDLSSEAVILARDEYPLCDFRVMDIESLAFNEEEFDWVTSYGVLEHLETPANGIQELSRVLIKGGRFALMMPTVGFYRKDRLDEGWYEDMNDPPQLQWNYRRDTWANMFIESGLILEPDDVAMAHGAINEGNFYFGSKPVHKEQQ